MANATAKVDTEMRTITGIPFQYFPVAGAAAFTIYEGAMVGINAAGYLVKCDDTAAIWFVGIAAEKITRAATDSNGDKSIKVWMPDAFIVTCTGVADTDHGKPVFAAFDNEVTLTVGTNQNYVGNVIEATATNEVLVKAKKITHPFEDVTNFDFTAGADNASITFNVGGYQMVVKATAT